MIVPGRKDGKTKGVLGRRNRMNLFGETDRNGRRSFSENRSRKRSFSGKSFPGKWNNRRRKKKIVLGRVEYRSRRKRNNKKKRKPFSEKSFPEEEKKTGKIEKCSWKRSFEGIGQIFPGQTKTGQPKTEEEDIVRIQGIERIFSEKRIETGKDRSRKIVPRKSGTTEETEE